MNVNHNEICCFVSEHVNYKKGLLQLRYVGYMHNGMYHGKGVWISEKQTEIRGYCPDDGMAIHEILTKLADLDICKRFVDALQDTWINGQYLYYPIVSDCFRLMNVNKPNTGFVQLAYRKYCGVIYDGPVNGHNQPHGKGKLLYFNQVIYEGIWKNGRPSDVGVLYSWSAMTLLKRQFDLWNDVSLPVLIHCEWKNSLTCVYSLQLILSNGMARFFTGTIIQCTVDGKGQVLISGNGTVLTREGGMCIFKGTVIQNEPMNGIWRVIDHGWSTKRRLVQVRQHHYLSGQWKDDGYGKIDREVLHNDSGYNINIFLPPRIAYGYILDEDYEGYVLQTVSSAINSSLDDLVYQSLVQYSSNEMVCEFDSPFIVKQKYEGEEVVYCISNRHAFISLLQEGETFQSVLWNDLVIDNPMPLQIPSLSVEDLIVPQPCQCCHCYQLYRYSTVSITNTHKNS